MRETINRILLVLMAIGLIIVIPVLYAPLYPLSIVFTVILTIVCIYVFSRPTEGNLWSFDGFMVLFIILLALIDFIIFLSLMLIFVANIIGG